MLPIKLNPNGYIKSPFFFALESINEPIKIPMLIPKHIPKLIPTGRNSHLFDVNPTTIPHNIPSDVPIDIYNPI